MRTVHQLSWTGWGGRSRVGSLLAYPPPIKKRKTNTAISTNTKIINRKKKSAAAQIHARAFFLLEQKIKNSLGFE